MGLNLEALEKLSSFGTKLNLTELGQKKLETKLNLTELGQKCLEPN